MNYTTYFSSLEDICVSCTGDAIWLLGTSGATGWAGDGAVGLGGAAITAMVDVSEEASTCIVLSAGLEIGGGLDGGEDILGSNRLGVLLAVLCFVEGCFPGTVVLIDETLRDKSFEEALTGESLDRLFLGEESLNFLGEEFLDFLEESLDLELLLLLLEAGDLEELP